jgi:SAM-dependent methyltransferase
MGIRMVRPLIDFGPAAEDYARHRPGFPTAFFDRVRHYGIGVAGQRILDLGCGTGALAGAFAQRGCWVVGLDPSLEMLQQARALARRQQLTVHCVRAWAEATGCAAAQFDVVCAGQSWHWFDGHRAAIETKRVLRPGGHVLLAYFTYCNEPGSLGAATEALVLRHNPTWPLAGADGRMGFLLPHLTSVGLAHVDTFEFDTDVVMTHSAWRGRLRACNGVLLMPSAVAQQFDAELAVLLAREYPEPLRVPHRAFAIIGRKL